MNIRLTLLFGLLFSVNSGISADNPERVKLSISNQEFTLIENAGQFPSEVNFSSPFAGGYIFYETDGMTFSLYDRQLADSLHGIMLPETQAHIGRHAYKMHWLNTQVPELQTEFKRSTYYNFYLGDDPDSWASHVKGFGQATYKNLYPGIDIQFTSEYNNPKYNVIVHSGADLSALQWEYEGADGVKINEGRLEVETSVGTLYEMKPFAYQLDELGQKQIVSCHYSELGGQFSFSLPNGYDVSRALIIDPVLVFSTYSGSTADNWGYTATNDQEEYAFGAGIAAGAGYPTTTGAFDTSFNGGGWDVAITKFTQDGTDQVFSTYLGGSDSDLPSSMIVNNSNQLVIIGFTGSSDFPTTAGAFSEDYNGGLNVSPLGGVTFTNGTDIFVTKFHEDGSAILASTFVGGSANDGINVNISNNYGDVFRSEVLVDISNSIYVASNTVSSNFPTTPGVEQTSLQGTQDAVLFKLSSNLDEMIWSTYWGGSSNDSGYSVEVNDAGTVFMCGGTLSNDLNLPAGGNQSSIGGATDGYIIRLEDGVVNAGTYVGTTAYDQTFFIELDSQQQLWTTGQTEGTFQVTPGAYSNPGAGQFLQKFPPDLSEIMVSTVFGDGSGFSQVNICQTAFLVDNCDRIFVSGWGGALNGLFGGTDGMPVTADAYQSTTDGSDFYVLVLEAEAVDILFASFMGANNLAEHVDGGTSRFSPKGIIYQAVCAGCGGSDNFPTTDGAWSETNDATNCNLAVFKYDLEIESLVAVATANPETQGCIPFTVNFSNDGSNGVSDFWDFGDGNTSTDGDPTYTYEIPGVYTVQYISEDVATCNISDTSYIQIVVQEPIELEAAFDLFTEPCQLSADVTIDYQGSDYENIVFDMGDGDSVNSENFVYTYDSPGSYTITLTITDDFCQSTESISMDVDVETATVNADISADVLSGCAPLTVQFDNTGSVGVNGQWWFDNGETSFEDNPQTEYLIGNDFTVTYIIQEDGGPCYDTAYLEIQVFNPIVMAPSFSVGTPLCSDSLWVNINYNGSDYDNIIWDMGDGNIIESEEDFVYYYDVEAVYQIEVTIFDEFCDQVASLEQEIEVDAQPGIFGKICFPNVITPNGDLLNASMRPFIMTDAHEIMLPTKAQMNGWFVEYELLVFNRWGNKIFESTGSEPFWDGRINGDPAPDGAYYYIARHELSCGNDPDTGQSGHFTVLTK